MNGIAKAILKFVGFCPKSQNVSHGFRKGKYSHGKNKGLALLRYFHRVSRLVMFFVMESIKNRINERNREGHFKIRRVLP